MSQKEKTISIRCSVAQKRDKRSEVKREGRCEADICKNIPSSI